MQSSCVSQDQWSWRQDLRPTLARGGWRGGLRPTLAREGWRGGLRPTLAREGWRGNLRPMLARGAGEKAPARRSRSCGRRASFRRGGNPPDAGLIPSNPTVPDAQGTVGHRESTILEGFPKHRAISGPKRKSARRSQACGHRAEICPGGNSPDARSRQEWSLT